MGSKIEKSFIMGIVIDGYGYRMIGSFESGELAMKGLQAFADRHKLVEFTAESEPTRCCPFMYVVQKSKTYINSHAPFGEYKSFTVDLSIHPEVWNPDEEVAKQIICTTDNARV